MFYMLKYGKWGGKHCHLIWLELNDLKAFDPGWSFYLYRG